MFNGKTHYTWWYMVIFHSYVELSDGMCFVWTFSKKKRPKINARRYAADELCADEKAPDTWYINTWRYEEPITMMGTLLLHRSTHTYIYVYIYMLKRTSNWKWPIGRWCTYWKPWLPYAMFVYHFECFYHIFMMLRAVWPCQCQFLEARRSSWLLLGNEGLDDMFWGKVWLI